MNISDRLKNFLYFKHVKVSNFESEIGFSNGYVNSVRKSIGNDKLERIVEHYPELNIEWLLVGKGEMLKSSAQNSAIVNEPETPYTTNTTAKLDEAREKIITLQEKLIEARDNLLENDKELFDLKDDFIAAQKKILELTDQILELTNQNHTLQQKYNSLKESILSKNIYNMLSDAEFLKEAKKKFNYIPVDVVFMFVYGSLLL